MEYPLGKDMGPVEVLWDGDGVPPPFPACERTHACENSTFRILWKRAVITVKLVGNNRRNSSVKLKKIHHSIFFDYFSPIEINNNFSK